MDRAIGKAGAHEKIWVNWDARGYTLKLKDPESKWNGHTDWGRNGILAPDLTVD